MKLSAAANAAATAGELQALTLYYDGHCALCVAEIHFLTARNRRGLLSFVDINGDEFAVAGHPVSCAEAMAAMRGQLGNGQLLTGVPVFIEAYRRADLVFLPWLLSRTWLRPVWDQGYLWFARHRHRLSRALGPTLLRIVDWWNSIGKAACATGAGGSLLLRSVRKRPADSDEQGRS